jgi:hypothetical protein
MKHYLSFLLAMACVPMTSACDNVSAPFDNGSESFSAGTWDLQSWMETEESDQQISAMEDTVVISDRFASAPPRDVAFSQFYRGESGSDVVFENGKISGHLNQGAIAPFPAHTQEVTGWYRSDAFEIRITLPLIANIQAYQVVTGKLSRPAS